MLLDAQNIFGTNQLLTAGGGTGDLVSTNVIDLTAPNNLYSLDDGWHITALLTVAATGGTSVTARLEGSVDNSTWTTLEVGPTRLLADLGTAGVPLAIFDTNSVVQQAASALPRYIRVVIARAGTFTAGQVSSFFGTETQVQHKIARNFVA